MSNPITIKLKEGRKFLVEGRRSGISIAFLKPAGEGIFEAIMPLSACKDYLNDIVYTEATGKSIEAYHLTTEKLGLFGGGSAHVCLASLVDGVDRAHGVGGNPKEVESMDKNLDSAVKFLNLVEQLLGLKTRTEMRLADVNLLYANLGLEWVSSTWAISMWGLLARNSFTMKGLADPMEDLAKNATFEDRMRAAHVNKCFAKFTKEGLPKQDMATMASWAGVSIHNNGIMNFNP